MFSAILRQAFSAFCSRPGVLGFLRRVFSAILTGCSRFPVPGVLGYPDRVFSVSCSRPSVLGFQCRVFSAILTRCSRFPVLDRGFRCRADVLLPRRISPSLQRSQLTVTSLQLRTRRQVPLGKRRPGILDRTHPLSTTRLTSRFPLQRSGLFRFKLGLVCVTNSFAL